MISCFQQYKNIVLFLVKQNILYICTTKSEEDRFNRLASVESVAQLVEHNTFNVGVPGSSPGGVHRKAVSKEMAFLSFGLSGRSFGRNVAPSHTIFASQESGKSPFVGIWRTVKSRYLCNERKDIPLCTGSGNIRLPDRMSDLVCGNYHILLIMSRFGIALGFGDHTVDEVCCQSGVDTATFLAVVNLLYDEGTTTVDCRNVSLEAFLRYLHNSHDYFLQYRLPDIRRKLSEGCRLRPRRDCGGDHPVLRRLCGRGTQAHDVRGGRRFFPYVRQLLTGECPRDTTSKPSTASTIRSKPN